MSDAYAIDETEGATPQLHLVDAENGEQHAIGDVMNAFAVLRFQNARLITNLAASCGITPTDFRALFFIAGSDEVTPKRVAEHLGLTTGAMTSLVDRIEAAGMLTRSPHPSDRRSYLLEITEAGQAVVDRGGAIYADAFSSAIAPGDLEAAHRSFAGLSRTLGAAADRLA
ncbi:MarR family winged helix-turn-helix transcriptional regulator [Schumannella sp. 10F1B-5-1]|uniref:MarR family winged helix-turn-helix transcriptional regulator n=1 Tax=Schumannella sp. 10F1B-5-1 TaxID=2590780 RepID=UPI0011322562|nr:MarR family transcriptional regulator [Schumannella sp. 10F1B-5-1]TPW76909.1 MarR family transcriptional regulator [Schumannella sp. 10F1B-5-1]